MATLMQSLRFAARRTNCRSAIQYSYTRQFNKRQPFSTTQLQRKESGQDGELSGSSEPSDAAATAPTTPASPSEPLDMEKLMRENLDTQLKEHVDDFIQSGIMGIDAMLGDEDADRSAAQERRQSAPKKTFMNMGEEEPFEDEVAEEEDEDEISTLGHLELEQHREMRYYARLAAWDMPLLSKMSKPFEPPTKNEPLRFRYTTYMGEQHPAEKKVVCEFSPMDMPNLTDVQREKLKKLAGVRYNPETEIIKMSSEMFGTQAQNKRYLGELVQKLLVEARDPTDTFEDIPLDTRHHVFKTKPKFPKEWRMTPERRAEVEAYRQAVIAKEQQNELAGATVDGIGNIKRVLAAQAAPPKTAVPEMVVAGKGRPQKATLRR
ncbi:37s ribosomal protein [Phlyctema vagabunda]|uniref:37s ribosomal protein n=1 Tax=Phlyctema vagabunda TaxID=108571 RepID=A0ABR4PLU6_9HELO